jgi:hypothetical protein
MQVGIGEVADLIVDGTVQFDRVAIVHRGPGQDVVTMAVSTLDATGTADARVIERFLIRIERIG